MTEETGMIVFFNARLVDAVIDAPGAVAVENGFITMVCMGKFPTQQSCTFAPDGSSFVDCGGNVLMPSFIDMHAHFRYPGQSEKEELSTALAASSAGGYTTLVLMPNTNPVISSPEQAAAVENEAAPFGKADVYQTMSLTRGFSGSDTSHLDDCGRVLAVTEDGRDVASSAVMLEAMEKCAAAGVIVSCHSEDPFLAAEAKKYRQRALDLMSQKNGEEGFSSDEERSACIDAALETAENLLALAEDTATARNIALARQAGCRVHIAHVSTENSIDEVRRAKRKLVEERSVVFGVFHDNLNGSDSAVGCSPVTCEVTPHHLACDCDEPLMRRYIVNPPLRPRRDRHAVIEGIADGTVDVIATDHAPHTASDKANGAPGFPGLETSFAACYTALVETGIITLSRLSALMSANPASILGLDKTIPCGRLLSGHRADLVIADVDREWIVDSSKFKTKGKLTPFEGKTVCGTVLQTWYRGRRVYSADE